MSFDLFLRHFQGQAGLICFIYGFDIGAPSSLVFVLCALLGFDFLSFGLRYSTIPVHLYYFGLWVFNLGVILRGNVFKTGQSEDLC
jgi:hypothetical protein